MFKRLSASIALRNFQGYGFARSGQVKPTATQPKVMLTELTNRSLLCLSGSDSKKLLQGIITNDMELLTGDQSALYTGFLNIKGRLITDAIITRPKIYKTNTTVDYKDNEFWIDVNREMTKRLTDHLRRYMWKKKAELSEIDSKEAQVYAAYNDEVFFDQEKKKEDLRGKSMEANDYPEGETGNYANSMFVDPRTMSMGLRIIASRDTFDKEMFIQTSPQVYQRFKILNGIAESPQTSDKIPFQFNLDLLNGISFKKGCYLGQELISRSYHTGIVRRRVFPFYLSDEKSSIPINSVLKTEDGKELGKVVLSDGNVGLVLLEYLGMNDFAGPKFVDPQPGQVLSPYYSEVVKYLEEIKKKQENLQKFVDL